MDQPIVRLKLSENMDVTGKIYSRTFGVVGAERYVAIANSLGLDVPCINPGMDEPKECLNCIFCKERIDYGDTDGKLDENHSRACGNTLRTVERYRLLCMKTGKEAEMQFNPEDPMILNQGKEMRSYVDSKEVFVI